jgi:conjugal transfer pilus assembly protein TraW
LAGAVALLISGQSCAEHLGRQATTYAPDADGREQLKDAIRAKERSGELNRFWRDYRNKVLEAIHHPAPLGLRTDYAASSELHDVRFTLPHDFVDQTGRVVAHRGQEIDPLAISPLTSGLLFIDGRDARQVEWAIRCGQASPLKIVLTAGSALELRENYRDVPWRGAKGVPFYFDQRGLVLSSLSRYYGIQVRSVPVRMTQQGSGLRLDYGMGVTP